MSGKTGHLITSEQGCCGFVLDSRILRTFIYVEVVSARAISCQSSWHLTCNQANGKLGSRDKAEASLGGLDHRV